MTDHFGDPLQGYEAARSGAALFDRSPHGKLEAAGADAVAFLHNLTTNDVKGLAPGAGCEAFLCTATGKAVAHALVFRGPPDGKRDRLWLDLPPGLAAKVLKHLDHYLISEDVTLTDHTPAWAQLHLAGPRAADVLARAGGGAVALGPLQHTKVGLAGGAVLRRTDALGLPGYDLLCPHERVGELRRALEGAGAAPAGPGAYEALRVEAGKPTYGIDIDDNTFAPEVGHVAQAISYVKGCYLGQEPIVMARDRGQVSRTLLGLKLAGDPVPPGSVLYRDGKEAGRVTSSVRSPRLGAIALAYVRRGSQQPGTALEVEAHGQRHRAEVAALPFPP